ncbi:Spy/CpxP family protein refolding chaperone, partial [Enterobacter hormaechei]
MRKVTAAVMASTLAFSAFSQAAVAIISDNGSSAEGATQHSSQSHMFDGISLTEHQRQQMRDLMQRARHDQPPVNVREGANKQVISSQADSLIKISRIWADF